MLPYIFSGVLQVQHKDSSGCSLFSCFVVLCLAHSQVCLDCVRAHDDCDDNQREGQVVEEFNDFHDVYVLSFSSLGLTLREQQRVPRMRGSSLPLLSLSVPDR